MLQVKHQQKTKIYLQYLLKVEMWLLIDSAPDFWGRGSGFEALNLF